MTEIPTNPHLDEFLQNTIAVKNEIEQNPELMEEIRKSLSEWARAYVYKTLVPNKYGIKKRDEIWGMIEATVTADLYKPDLHISPFCLIIQEGCDVAYLTKDFFGEVDNVWRLEAGFHEEEALSFPPITEAVEYIFNRGYGRLTKDSPGSFFDDYWMNLFLYDPKTKEWAMHDLECINLCNHQHIADGVENNKGRFSRLHDIWKVLNSDKYRLDLNGGGK